jgi:hypothetical protein
MERAGEEAKTQESARGGPRPAGRPGTQRGQEARQPGERPQGRPGQKPQEDPRRPAQRAAAAARAPQERVSAAISSIQARFGKYSIGLGYLGIRYVRVRLEPSV